MKINNNNNKKLPATCKLSAKEAKLMGSCLCRSLSHAPSIGYPSLTFSYVVEAWKFSMVSMNVWKSVWRVFNAASPKMPVDSLLF